MSEISLHEAHESHESHETHEPREGRSRSYSFYTVCIRSSSSVKPRNHSENSKSFEQVFILSKIPGPRLQRMAKSFEPNSLLRISEISEMLRIDSSYIKTLDSGTCLEHWLHPGIYKVAQNEEIPRDYSILSNSGILRNAQN